MRPQTTSPWSSTALGVATCLLALSCSSGNAATVAEVAVPRPLPPTTTAQVLNGNADDPGASTSDTTVSSEGTEPMPTGAPVLALATPSGVIVPIRGGEPGAWVVGTPCHGEAVIEVGTPIPPVRVVIDPGHGGPDEPGAVGPNGLEEADLNLLVSEQVIALLADAGVPATLTRTMDYRMAIVARAELVMALTPEVFISIHHNGGPVTVSAEPGTEVYHQLGSTESERLGGLLFEELTDALAPFGDQWAASEFQGVLARVNRNGEDLYGVLRRTQGVVSVLTEALYLSEPAEAALLAESEVVNAEAEAIATAVLRYLNTDEDGSGHLDDHTFLGRLGGGGGTAGCVDPPLD